MQPKFDLGKITVSTEALCALVHSGQDADFFLRKHASGDWGICDPASNEQGLRERSMVFSRYRTLRGKEIVVRTILAKGETSLYCECNPVSVNHGYVYDTAPVNHGVVYDSESVNLGHVYDTGPVHGCKYDCNFGPISATGGTAPMPYDLPGLVGSTIDPGPAAPKEADSVDPESAFKYDAIHQDYGPFSPIYKASPYYTGPAPKKPDPGKPSEEQP